jgi:hypothetical protein
MLDALIRPLLLIALVTADADPQGGNGRSGDGLKGAPIEIIIP